ncbi:hypothetical protein Hanom_Chr04g00331501 [Helianthus anomalus]
MMKKYLVLVKRDHGLGGKHGRSKKKKVEEGSKTERDASYCGTGLEILSGCIIHVIESVRVWQTLIEQVEYILFMLDHVYIFVSWYL